MTYKHKVFILQLAVAFLFIWFGVEKLLFPERWIMFIPAWFHSYIKINAAQFVLFVGAIEAVLGIWVLLPWKTHFAAYAALLYFIPVIAITGVSHAGVRDISLAVSTLALALFAAPPKIDLHFSR